MKIGIIGFGKMGQIRATAVEQSGQADIISVYDNNQETDFRNYPVAASPDAIIEDPSVHAVFICTPNNLNKPLTIAALQAGKHVFCEKPPAFNSADVLEIQQVEEQSGKKLMYGFNHRHHRSIKHMRELIESRDYGHVIWMRGRYGKSVDKHFFGGWRAQKELAGGGILLDQGIHLVDLFQYFGGVFDQVNAFISNQYWKRDIEDNVFAILRNSQSGVTASLHSTMTQWRHLFSLEVFMSRGYLVLNGLLTSTGTYGDEVLSIARNRSKAPAATWEDEERITYDSDKSWRSEVDHFFEAIDNDLAISIGSSTDALNVMRTIDAIYMSDPTYER